MFECERCGSSYSASHIGVEHCPRCRLRDRVETPLAFKAFRRTADREAAGPAAARQVPDPASMQPDGMSATP